MSEIDPAIAKQFDRLPPHSIESEMCLIGSMLIDADVREQLCVEVNREDFFQLDHKFIFDCIVAMQRARIAVDGMTLRTELDKRHQLSDVGGVEYIGEILNSVPSAIHGPSYAAEVARTAALRRIITASNDAIRRCYSPSQLMEPVEEIAADLKSACEIATAGGKDSAVMLGAAVRATLEAKEKKEAPAIPTGLKELDDLIDGIRVGKMTVIGGRPGMGKSQLVKQIALNVARAGHRVLIVSVEEDREKIADNMLSNASGVFNQKVRRGVDLNQQDWNRLVEVTGELESLPIWIDDAPSKLQAIEAAICRRVARDRVTVVLVDYLQLIDASTERGDTREGAIRQISNGLKRIFKRMRLAGVVAAQLNRAMGSDRPTLTNLRESGSIEQDADVAILLYREDYAKQSEQGYVPNHTLECIVAKNKDGQCGTAAVRFQGEFQRIMDFEDDPTP